MIYTDDKVILTLKEAEEFRLLRKLYEAIKPYQYFLIAHKAMPIWHALQNVKTHCARVDKRRYNWACHVCNSPDCTAKFCLVKVSSGAS